jgi:hypothetical protein
MAARGNKVAFVAYRTLPKGGADFGTPQQAGQIDLVTGNIDWLVPLGNAQYDYYLTYDMAIAPNGDVIIAASGYGELLLGDKLGQFDGFIASFDTNGNKRFAHRFEIHDVEPSIADRPHFVGAKIVTDDVIRVCTGFYVTPPGQATFTAVHLFSFTTEGTQTYRKEVPKEPGGYYTHVYPVADDSWWVYHAPAPYYRYSKDGSVINTLVPPADAIMMGFAPMGLTSGLINLTTKGMTNELHHFDVEIPLVPLFNEPTFPQFHAAAIRQTLGFAKTYFIESAYNGASHRFATIDAQGHRGPVTTLEGITHQFALFDEGLGVFFRATDSGTEWIVQPL